MLILHLSTNLGVTYRIVEKFDSLAAANLYISNHMRKLEKGRWFVIDEDTGRIVLVCSIFESVAYQVIHNAVGVSDDMYLRRYLRQRRFDKVTGIV